MNDGTFEWDPMRLDTAVELFAGAPFRWWISGGIALELHVGESWRDHDDIDIGIVRQDSDVAYRWLEGWEMAVASNGHLTPWRGEPLSPSASQNNVWLRSATSSKWVLDLTVGAGSDTHWASRRDTTIARSWTSAVLRTPDGVPYLAPDLQLLFKAKSARAKDHVDAERVIPVLDPQETLFLSGHLPDDHPWQDLLTGRS